MCVCARACANFVRKLSSASPPSTFGAAAASVSLLLGWLTMAALYARTRSSLCANARAGHKLSLASGGDDHDDERVQATRPNRLPVANVRAQRPAN